MGLAACAYSVRRYGIFSCSASGYSSDKYLSYCEATSYGDYEYGAFWFPLERSATAAAAKADVMFLGNSRANLAFSSKATSDWFSSLSESYYLLGFSNFGNYKFEWPLLRKIHPKAKVYVINIDAFFDQSESEPARAVMEDDAAKTRYEEKRYWQWLHKPVCATFKFVCKNHYAIFRSRSSGAWLWVVPPGWGKSAPVSYDENIDQNMVASYTAMGNQFLPTLSASRACTILTIVPTVNTNAGTAKAIATALGLNLIAPTPEGLATFDGSHLDPESSERWSAAFLEQAGPQIRKCLSE